MTLLFFQDYFSLCWKFSIHTEMCNTWDLKDGNKGVKKVKKLSNNFLIDYMLKSYLDIVEYIKRIIKINFIFFFFIFLMWLLENF